MFGFKEAKVKSKTLIIFLCLVTWKVYEQEGNLIFVLFFLMVFFSCMWVGSEVHCLAGLVRASRDLGIWKHK